MVTNTRPSTNFGCLPTAIGSMPHTDPIEASKKVAQYLKDIPAWPQLPKRSFLENMCVQFSQGLPGVVLERESEHIYIDRSNDLKKPLEKFYTDYLKNDYNKYPITAEYAAGLHAFLSLKGLSPWAVKGQITGPVTWGLTIKDEYGQGIIYDDVMSDAVAKLLRLEASWQEKQLRRISRNTIIFVDEPYMGTFGSAFVPISREKVISLLEEVLGGISGLRGLHCCGNTDWPVLLDTSIDIISYDAYNYAETLSLYPTKVKKFLDRKGAIAWGIIPIDEAAISKETLTTLRERLEETWALFTRNGIPLKQLVEQGLLTPSCSLTLFTSNESAEHALELLAKLSSEIRERYL